jgi:predicted phage tail protein
VVRAKEDQAMNIVEALNAVSSQVWAVVLVVLGIGTFALTCVCHAGDVRAALMSSGTGMIGGGIAMFQHQPKTETDHTKPPA